MSFIHVDESMNVSKIIWMKSIQKSFFVISLMGTNVARIEWKMDE
jgi:hypothetical protein